MVPKPNSLHIYTANTKKNPATQRCCAETSCSSKVGKGIENTGEEIVWLQYEVYDTGIGIPGLDLLLYHYIIFLPENKMTEYCVFSYVQKRQSQLCLNGTCKQAPIMLESMVVLDWDLPFANNW